MREVCRCVINGGGEILFDRIDMGMGFLDRAENCSQRFKLNIIGVKIGDSTPDNLVGKDIKNSLCDNSFGKEIYWCLVHPR